MDWAGNKESQYSFTVIHKHNEILHNSLSKVENGLDREREKAVLISIHTVTHKL